MPPNLESKFPQDSPGQDPPDMFSRPAFAWVILVLLVGLTLWLWHHINLEVEANAKVRFDYRINQQKLEIQDRLHAYEQVLYGAAGLFKSSDFVSREEWRIYVEALQLPRWLPGIQGVGYSLMIPGSEKAAHEAWMRKSGFPDYAIYPAGDREIYSSIIYLEPFSGRNLRAFSYDMYSEPVRRAAMDRAMESGNPALSGKVTLVQEMGKEVQPGFLIYLPIYRKDVPHNTPESRRAALVGFVYSPFRAGDLMSNIFNDAQRDVDVEIFDENPLPANLLFESAPGQPAGRLFAEEIIEVEGRKWTLHFHSNSAFDATVSNPLSWVILGGGLLVSFVVFVALHLNAKHSRKSIRDQRQLARSAREIRTLAEMTDMLQSCNSRLEAYPVIATTMIRLFPGMSGGCYILNASETALESVVEWGGNTPEEKIFAPEDCWAMRRGKMHAICDGNLDNQPCKHLHNGERNTVCVPMLAQAKAMGMLLLKRDEECHDLQQVGHQLELIHTVVDSISLALANLILRESLQETSVRDPLTGLYNRRFMEAMLDRELRRMERAGEHLAIAMLDLDHFKVINDNLGHAAGDLVLKELGRLMRSFRQGADVACRYGGEEFILILPEVEPDGVLDRMETLRQSIEKLNLSLEGVALPCISASIGVALFPQHGNDPQQLIKQADEAMYRAKREGRNRVVIAG
jgi:diguanylate cyclase (GGDEF)-like protein